MELRLLRYFLAAAREENITRAAQTLHIAQSSLSKQLMELEQELGKQLFIRGKRKLTLTEEGSLLRKRADEILTLCEKTEREIARDTAVIAGEISIGGVLTADLAAAAARMAEKYPDVRFQLSNGDAEELTERLDHGTLDFAVLIEPADLVKYEHLTLREGAAWGLMMRKDCALAGKRAVRPEDVRGLPLIVPQRIGLQRELAVWLGVELEQLNIAASFDIMYNSPMLLVENGLGYMFSLDTQIHSWEGRSLCFRPFDPPMEIQYGLVWKRYPAFSRAASAFLEELRETRKEETG